MARYYRRQLLSALHEVFHNTIVGGKCDHFTAVCSSLKSSDPTTSAYSGSKTSSMEVERRLKRVESVIECVWVNIDLPAVVAPFSFFFLFSYFLL